MAGAETTVIGMSMHQVVITPNAPGLGLHRFEVDGHDITHAVHKAALWLEPGCLPELEVELHLLESRRLEAEDAVVSVPAATREALVALGWTPPGEEVTGGR